MVSKRGPTKPRNNKKQKPMGLAGGKPLWCLWKGNLLFLGLHPWVGKNKNNHPHEIKGFSWDAGGTKLMAGALGGPVALQGGRSSFQEP